MHGGGYLGAYSGRIDHAWGARSDVHGDLPKPPTSYLRRIYFDTVVFTPHQLEGAGEDLRRRPRRAGHRLSVRHARSSIRSGMWFRSRFDDDDTRGARGGNAKKLLGL